MGKCNCRVKIIGHWTPAFDLLEAISLCMFLHSYKVTPLKAYLQQPYSSPSELDVHLVDVEAFIIPPF